MTPQQLLVHPTSGRASTPLPTSDSAAHFVILPAGDSVRAAV